VFSYALNADLRVLVNGVSYSPFNDSEVHTLFLTGIDAFRENTLIEEVTNQADSETLKVVALGVSIISNSFISLS